MINTPSGYWYLGTADSISYATEIAEKYKETAKDGGCMIIRKETDKKIVYIVFAKDK